MKDISIEDIDRRIKQARDEFEALMDKVYQKRNELEVLDELLTERLNGNISITEHVEEMH